MEKDTKEAELGDMHARLGTQDSLDVHNDGLDRYNCEDMDACQVCYGSVGLAAYNVVQDLDWGTDEHCSICLQCFKARLFRFAYACDGHNKDTMED